MNKVLGKKTVFFASLFLLGFSFLADFILPVLNFHSLRGYLFWPVAISIVSMLIIQNGFSLPRFSVYSLWLVLILAVGFCIRFYRLGALPINHDEAHTTLRSVILLRNNYCVSYAQFPVSCFYGKIPSPFPLLVAVASRWLKSLEGIVRLPAVIFGTLTIWLVYRLVKEWLDKRTALLSAFLLAVFPWHIMQSRVGVEVILTPFCGALVFYLFSKAVKKQNVIYLYLSSVMVSIAAFWTYTASQVYLAVYVMCCLMLRKELSWVKLIDWINCAL
ncbi:MAG: glycosyltransferase family 39 protein, partial [Candidatus Omnitrophica bacterium]|nr:glycosyltransferase family 39 protein [Candidatus Omnitrophota bacterium]